MKKIIKANGILANSENNSYKHFRLFVFISSVVGQYKQHFVRNFILL